MIVDQKKVRKALEGLDGEQALRRLFERELGYDYEGGLISSDEQPAGVEDEIISEPTLIASRQELDNKLATVEIVAADGNLYQRHDNGWIWRYTGP